MDSEIFSGSKNFRMIREFNSSKANSESEELRLIGTHDIHLNFGVKLLHLSILSHGI